jgi:prevent-host-death family protein
MDIIAHRDLRNRSSEILARVGNGESIAVTNHGKLVAVISPPASSPLEQVRQAGEVREARHPDVRFEQLVRTRLAESTAGVLDDLRGDR